jgi:predicted nucleic acid-binding protein
MIILDTNVISEQMQPEPDGRVDRWFDSVESASLAITTITVAELRFSAARLPQSAKRTRLELWIHDLVSQTFRGRILEFGLDATIPYASLRARRFEAGRPIAFQDAQIAAICSSQYAMLATRNTKDFDGLGITLINPWEY